MGETLDFKRDVNRKLYFVDESREHGAKLELRTFEWLVNRYTSPGDTILDPMSGIGTVHFAATIDRRTWAIELAERFVEIQHMNMDKLDHTCLGRKTQRYHFLTAICRRGKFKN